jgi:hypothetical protein
MSSFWKLKVLDPLKNSPFIELLGLPLLKPPQFHEIKVAIFTAYCGKDFVIDRLRALKVVLEPPLFLHFDYAENVMVRIVINFVEEAVAEFFLYIVLFCWVIVGSFDIGVDGFGRCDAFITL